MHFSPSPMHIPDGFLSITVSLLYWLFSIFIIIIALRRVDTGLNQRHVPLMGILGAAIFAGQMLNFPVGGGTSGHLLGAALAAILVGPWVAILVMTCVVATQALIFQDGGLLAMGANLFNMAIVSVLVSHLVYTLIRKISVGKKWGLLAGGFLAAWVSVEAAALSCALQLSFSGTIPSRIVIPVMGGVHALIGLGEGLITIGALSYIYATRSDLLQAGSLYPKNSRGLLIGGTILASTLAILSPLASSYPDGLDSIAQRYGFMNLEHFLDFPPLSGYTMPGIYNPVYGTILAALLGAFVVFLLVGLIAFIRRHGLLKRE